MGTNYYIMHKDEDLRRIFGKIHLGKNSCGWYFSLHVYPERGILSWKDWNRVLEARHDLVIFDEYENVRRLDEIQRLVMKDRSSDKSVDLEQLEQIRAAESKCCPVEIDREHKLLYQLESKSIGCYGPDPDVRATLLEGDFS